MAEELINSGKIIKKPEIVVNPNFFLPPGVVDAREMDEEEFNLGGTKGDSGKSYGDGSAPPVDIIDAGPPGVGLLPPFGIDILSQEVRTTASGAQVVDVIIEFADIAGATGYDLRIGKAGQALA